MQLRLFNFQFRRFHIDWMWHDINTFAHVVKANRNLLNSLIMCVRILTGTRNCTLPCLQNAWSESIFLLARFMNIFFFLSILNYASCFRRAGICLLWRRWQCFLLLYFTSQPNARSNLSATMVRSNPTFLRQPCLQTAELILNTIYSSVLDTAIWHLIMKIVAGLCDMNIYYFSLKINCVISLRLRLLSSHAKFTVPIYVFAFIFMEKKLNSKTFMSFAIENNLARNFHHSCFSLCWDETQIFMRCLTFITKTAKTVQQIHGYPLFLLHTSFSKFTHMRSTSAHTFTATTDYILVSWALFVLRTITCGWM